MKRTLALLLFASLGGRVLAQNNPGSSAGITAFVGVTVIPMNVPQVLKDQVVLVRGERVAEVGAVAAVKIPADARRIDGHGLFLMPGMADMHVHFLEKGKLGKFDTYFPLYLASGVTTVRLMGTPPDLRTLRDEINQGTRLGPTLLLTGQLIDGPPAQWGGSNVVTTPEQARNNVDRQKRDGYDFVKVYDNLSVAAYDAVVDEAHKQHVPVVGHVPYPGGLAHVLKIPLDSIEHVEAFFIAAQRHGSPYEHVSSVPPHLGHRLFPPPKYYDDVDEARLPELAAATAKAGSWVVPTLMMPMNVLSPQETAEAFNRPMVKYATPYLRGWWGMGVEGVDSEGDWAAIRHGKELRLKVVRALHDAGVPLLVGTDTPHAFVVPGFAVHDEIQLLVRAGLSPFDAIAAATVNVGKFLRRPKTVGLVAPGAQADLVLLKGNPLEDVKNLSQISGVMRRGRWYPQEELQRGLDEMAAQYAEAEHHGDAGEQGRH